jgi:hypothetical protein
MGRASARIERSSQHSAVSTVQSAQCSQHSAVSTVRLWSVMRRVDKRACPVGGTQNGMRLSFWRLVLCSSLGS